MTVACILPTADRPHFLERAVKCFQAQTYPHKELIIVDSGTISCGASKWKIDDPRIHVFGYSNSAMLGELRNEAISLTEAALIAHLDDDDWSHPNRIAEQVALIESTGADIVGYRDMLFYNSTHKWKGIQQGGSPSELGTYEWVRYCDRCGMEDTCEDPLASCSGELHLYTAGRSNNHMGCGTSYMYRRSVWENLPFPAVTVREDKAFLYRIPVEKRMFASSLEGPNGQHREPRMIAEIHGANTIRNRPMSAQNWVQIVDEPMIADVRKMLGYA